MKQPDNAMTGRFPQFVVAQLRNGHWAGFRLGSDGYEQITLSRYSPSDAALALAAVLTTIENELQPGF